jgi:hypothetical protein
MREAHHSGVVEAARELRGVDAIMSRQLQQPSIVDVAQDPSLFGSWFDGPSWSAWMTFLRSLFALPFDESDLATFQHHTGRSTAPQTPFRESWVVVGRRGGKSVVAAAIAVYLAVFVDFSRCLKKGEIGTIALIASDRKQARVLLRYIKAFLDLDAFHGIVTNSTQQGVELRNGIVIEVHSASYRSVRGYTLLAALLDEIAFWRTADNSANLDTEIVSAIRPALSTIPTSLLLAISSPYARRGQLWSSYQRHFAKDASPVLVWQASSREMNAMLPQSIVDDALAEDEVAARAEYFGEFRSDLESFIDSLLAKSLVIPGRSELPPSHKIRYYGFADPAGGSGADSYTMGIAHREADRFIVDVLREVRPPFSPEQTTIAFAETFKRYRITKILGDKFAGSWPSEQFRKCGVTYDSSAEPKTEIYKNTLPLFNGRTVELPDNPRLLTQLVGLERRTGRGGNDSIDHSPGAHDDLINSACGALLLAAHGKTAGRNSGGIF